jgi:hypothetical protein
MRGGKDNALCGGHLKYNMRGGKDNALCGGHLKYNMRAIERREGQRTVGVVISSTT